ncbi:hypothetical protein LTR56_023400 [Elasticomyces elasticus]|nr:hypothetical protein LTR22_027142 [Elasticomyces elasticus]KAK3620428.1 hypothetical protein LTR56_023400 [Elasticomyces elasticus]KAK4928237.1 hypothetical protein LTR49_004914 [Elasticomyces elasticus]KAK5682892.1 hypothetical protein LTR17_027315 [Elasticomyces elasticus]KAK5734203.1 hypothetical protein LTS12_026763 [Elasticomyces elasticus]
MAPRLRIDGATFRDPQNREIYLHGLNVAGDTKFPAHPDVPSHIKERFFEGDTVSFVDRPFSLAEAHTHFTRLKKWGYNTLRYVFTWECLEHAGPGKYDEEFIDHTIAVLRVAKEYGFYVFMDPHQDVWSRFTGGSGAPMWTLYACGFDPKKLFVTQAALVQNTWPDPTTFPKMAWATNYQRLACQTMFTMFYSGKDFAPKCVIDGKNIQDYLEDHFFGACRHLAQRIRDAGDLEDDCVIGYESMNEPNKGFVGHPDLTKVPKDQNLRKYTTPTAWQAMLTGSGRAQDIDTYDFGSFGPYKSGTVHVDPKGVSCWLDPETWDDSTYGWNRAESWKLGTDIWAQHGVWDPKADAMLLPQYFAKHPTTGETLDQEYWTNHYFLAHYRQYRDAIRSVNPETIMLCQPSPFEIPPTIKGTPDDEKNMIFASHFYDGITLITKKWNKIWNVDVLGILRGRYSSPAFAIKLGETAIRNCFKDQLSEVRREGDEHMGVHPCLYTEIGIPYDMDEQKAYKTGDYSSQAAAIDANHFALEGSKAGGFTWWVYTASNSHFWGDNWNGEDLSIYSAEDKPLPEAATRYEDGGKSSMDPSSTASSSRVSMPVTSSSLQKTMSVDELAPQSTRSTNADEALGYRAAEAFVRPHPEVVHGTIASHGFDLKNCTFTLILTSPSATPQEYPTIVFLPSFHFPQNNPQTSVEVSGGKWEIRTEEIVEGAGQQVLRWWHGEGEQKITVKGVKRKAGTVVESGEEQGEGVMEAYWQMGRNCAVM